MRNFVVWGTLVLLMGAGMARGSDPTGIYGIVDRVVIEPSDADPQRVQIWGVFALAEGRGGDAYSAPASGYLYYALPKAEVEKAKTEWLDLKRVAGTGQPVAFGARYAERGRVRGGVGPSAGVETLDEARLAQLVKQLDDPKQSVRDAATDELARMGRVAGKHLSVALREATSQEAKQRLYTLTQQLEPDVYPLGWGVRPLRQENPQPLVKRLLETPDAVSPEDGDVVPAAGVTLAVQTRGPKGQAPVTFKFEIENGAGEREASPAIEGVNGRGEWQPKMKIEAGQRYVWRAWQGESGSVVTSTFRAK
jgi:hypothetical protein